jgi:hypothetical protein
MAGLSGTGQPGGLTQRRAGLQGGNSGSRTGGLRELEIEFI